MEDPDNIRDFLEVMERYSPAIPEEVVSFYLSKAGFVTEDRKIIRMIALAAQKFVSDIAHDAMQYQKIRTGNNREVRNTKLTLAMEDLSASLAEYGVTVTKPEYISNSSTLS